MRKEQSIQIPMAFQVERVLDQSIWGKSYSPVNKSIDAQEMRKSGGPSPALDFSLNNGDLILISIMGSY